MIFKNNNNLKEDNEFYYFYNISDGNIGSSISFKTLKYIFEEENFIEYSSIKTIIFYFSCFYNLDNSIWQGKVAKADLEKHFSVINCSYEKVPQETIKKLIMLL